MFSVLHVLLLWGERTVITSADSPTSTFSPWVCSSTVTAHIPGRAPVDVVFLFVPCRWFTVVRGEVCVFSQACVKVAAQGGKQCVCVGGVQVGLIMHRQQWLQWSSEDDLRTVRLCDVSVGSSRDREEQAHAETICQLQILWQTFS